MTDWFGSEGFSHVFVSNADLKTRITLASFPIYILIVKYTVDRTLVFSY